MNAQLARYLREGPKEREQPLQPNTLSYPRHRRWRVRNRLSSHEITELITAFKAGTPKHVLAKRYGINLSSLKRLLREEGVKRRSRWDIQA